LSSRTSSLPSRPRSGASSPLTDIGGELRKIHHEIADTNVRVTLTNERLADLRTEAHTIRADVRTGLATQCDHAARIQRLEEGVFKRTG